MKEFEIFPKNGGTYIRELPKRNNKKAIWKVYNKHALAAFIRLLNRNEFEGLEE